MRTKFYISGLFIVLAIYSCKKDSTSSHDFPYEATVVGLNGDCGLYMIKITKGLETVKQILGSSNDTYIAANLPDTFKVVGLSIQLDLRKPKDNELGICTTLGIAYPWTYITKVSHTTCFDYSLYIKNKDNMCPQNCPGVIGCDGKTYCNVCEAAKFGIKIK